MYFKWEYHRIFILKNAAGKQTGRLRVLQQHLLKLQVLCFPYLPKVMGFLRVKCTSLTVWSQQEVKLLIHRQFSCPAVQKEGKQDSPKCIIRLPKRAASSVFSPHAGSFCLWPLAFYTLLPSLTQKSRDQPGDLTKDTFIKPRIPIGSFSLLPCLTHILQRHHTSVYMLHIGNTDGLDVNLMCVITTR